MAQDNTEDVDDGPLEALEVGLDFIFSAVLLTAASVIFGGHWLGRCLYIPEAPRALFRISIPRFFTIEARGSEVALGITTFVFTFLIVALVAGDTAYVVVRERIGVDLGQFNSLCLLSGFAMLPGTFLIYLIVRRPWVEQRSLVDEQRDLLQGLNDSDEDEE